VPGGLPGKALGLLRESLSVSLTLFRIMIPVVIGVRILEETGAITHIGAFLSPVMRIVGLPGGMGLVWATAMTTNLYGGIVTFVSTAPAEHLSVADVTVLTTMMLVAHSMPVELGVARQAGARMRFMLPLRLAGAFVLGALLSAVFTTFGLLEQEAVILWEPSPPAAGTGAWALGQARNLGTIFVIVTLLIALLKVFRRTGITALIDRGLRPALVSMGIGPSASTITIFGMILGLSYGGGLIIGGARSGSIPPRDVFFSLSLMGLAHSVIEDSLLMLSLGASAWGVLAARVLFAWLVLLLLVRIVRRIPDRIFYRWLCHPPAAATAGQRNSA
jgi:hypothetical protein